MPRTGRLHIPGGYYHVIGRGLERRRIFEKTIDKEDFLERLGVGLKQTQSQCLAWVVMPNHYHLMIRVKTRPLKSLMSRVLSGYATKYNLRYHRAGYVFQYRYKSILCDADDYLLELIRYIHLNPLKAGIVKTLPELRHYRWSGHAGMMGRNCQDWHDTHEVLTLYNNQIKPARQQYEKFVREGMNEIKRRDLSGGGLVRSYDGWENIKSFRKEHIVRIGDERILGSSHFVERVLKEDTLKLIERSKWQQEGWDLKRLSTLICQYVDVAQAELQNKGRVNKVSRARELFCYWGIHDLGWSSTDVAIFLGISQPAVSKASKRGEKYCHEQCIEFKQIAKT